MCSKKGEPNYYRCDKDCNENRRKRRANKDALAKALDDKDMAFIAAQTTRLDPVNGDDLSDDLTRYYEASDRVDNVVERFSNGETISYTEITRTEKDLRYIGSVIAHEAEDRAGITPTEIDSDWSERYAEALQEYEEMGEIQRQNEELLEEVEDDEAAYNALYDGTVDPHQQAYIAKYQEIVQMRDWADEETTEKVNTLADAYRTVLAEERHMGGSIDAVGENEEGYRAIANNAHYLPADWVQACNESPYELHIEHTTVDGREQYDNRSTYTEKAEYPDENGRPYIGSRIQLPAHEMGTVVGDRKAMHEYLHHVQSHYKNRLIEKLEAVHIDSRRRVIKGEKENVQVIARGDTVQEWGYVDHFVNSYMGKVNHDQRHYEVMTTGVEALFKGSHYGLVRKDGTADNKMRDFVLGVMAKI